VVNKVLKRHGSYIESFKIMGSIQADSEKSSVSIAIGLHELEEDRTKDIRSSLTL
jgi:hypothetical protein